MELARFLSDRTIHRFDSGGPCGWQGCISRDVSQVARLHRGMITVKDRPFHACCLLEIAGAIDKGVIVQPHSAIEKHYLDRQQVRSYEKSCHFISSRLIAPNRSPTLATSSFTPQFHFVHFSHQINQSINQSIKPSPSPTSHTSNHTASDPPSHPPPTS